MLHRNASQLEDPVLRLWDAVAGGQASPAHDQDAETFSLIREFFARDDAPAPDAAFLGRLEDQLFTVGTSRQAARETDVSQLLVRRALPSRVRRALSITARVPGDRLRSFGRWTAAQAAMVILLAIAIGSFGIVYLVGQSDDIPMIPAIVGDPGDATPEPGTPVVETLLSATFDPGAVGAEGQSDWTTASLFSYSIEPGEGFALDEATWGSSLNVFVMLEGELSVQSGSSSQVFRPGSNVPETVNAGERVTIVAGDSWVAGFDTEVSGRNDGTSAAEVLIHANTKDWPAFNPPKSFPGALPLGVHAGDDNLAIQFDGPVTLDIQRVTLDQGEELDVHISDSETLLLMSSDLYGRSVRITAGDASGGTSINATALHTWIGRAYTITRDLSGTGSLYIARMRNAPGEASTAAASPMAQQAAMEELVQFLADPAALQIGEPEAWNQIKFEIASIDAGVTVDTSQSPFYCCRPGLTAMHVLQGAMDLQIPGASYVIRAGQDPSAPEKHEPSASVTLNAGDTIWYRIDTSAHMTSSGADPLRILSLSVLEKPDDEVDAGTSPPSGLHPSSFAKTGGDQPLMPGSVSTTFSRISLDSGEQFTLTLSENQRLIMLIDQGGIQYHKATGDKTPIPSLIHSRGQGYGVAFHTFNPGDFIIENPRDPPATLYVMSLTTMPD